MTAPTIRALGRRDRMVISVCIGAVIVLAWGDLFLIDHRMSPTMRDNAMMLDMGMSMTAPWGIADVLFMTGMWIVMMVAMMAGSAMPVLLLFGALRTERKEHHVRLAVLAFALGYGVIWVAFSAGAAIMQWRLHDAALLSPAMSASSPRMAGSALMIAGAYQWTPFKEACLSHCRNPLGFLITNWRDGTIGAVRMGIGHGAYCLGCCGALMCVLFVVGIMNLAWVAALSLFILAEKIGPAFVVVSRGAGALMIVSGAMVLAGLV